MGRARFGDVERHACSEEGPKHVRKGCKKEGASAPAVDSIKRGYSEDKHSHSEAPGNKKCHDSACPGLNEDRRTVESDDVNLIEC